MGTAKWFQDFAPPDLNDLRGTIYDGNPEASYKLYFMGSEVRVHELTIQDAVVSFINLPEEKFKVPHPSLRRMASYSRQVNNFNPDPPDIVIQDDFYQYPEDAVNLAHAQQYVKGTAHYKGLRSQRVLLPWVKEQFERLLNITITDWLLQPHNGVFHMATKDTPVVYHSDHQRFAAAIYLFRNPGCGTRFYSHKETGLRFPATYLERRSFYQWNPSSIHYDPSPLAIQTDSLMFNEQSVLSPDTWKVESEVDSIFNRLVIWNGRMIHSGVGYFGDGIPWRSRLVHLYFFNGVPK